MKTLCLAICAILLVCSNAQSQGVGGSVGDNGVNLTSKDSYQKLNSILNRISERLDKLESDVRQLKNSGNEAMTGQEPKAMLENSFISVYNQKVTKTNDGILISFIIKNKSGKNIMLLVSRKDTIINDGSGAAIKFPDVSGIGDSVSDYPNQRSYSVLNDGVPTPVSLHFKADKIKGDTIAFKVGLIHLKDDKATPYSFGAARVRLEN